MRSTVSSQRSLAETTISRGVNAASEEIPRFHPLGDRDPRDRQGRCSDVDVGDEVIANRRFLTWGAHDQGDMDALVVAELLAPGVADPVIGEEENPG